MAFNPDAYLKKSAENSGGFDPDSYLSKPAGGKDSTVGQTVLENYGNTVTLGHLPHLQAVAGKLMPDAGADVDEKLKKEGFTISEPAPDTYIQARDKNIARQTQQSKDNPWAARLGTGLGFVGGGLVMPSAALAKGATLGARALSAAKAGAALGALQNPGDVEGDISFMPMERAKNAGIGAAIGGLSVPAIEFAGKGAKAASDWLTDKASLKAFRALGRPTPTNQAKFTDTGMDKAIGRELLDEGAIPVLGTPGRIKARVEPMKEQAGKAIGDLLDRAETEIAQQEAAGTAPFGGFRRNGTEIRMSPLKETKLLYGQPEMQGLNIPVTASPASTKPVLPKGKFGSPEEFYQAQRAVDDASKLSKSNTFGWDYGHTPEVPVSTVETKLKFGKPDGEVIGHSLEAKSGYRIDSGKLADAVRHSEDFARMRKIPGMEGAVGKIEGYLQTLERNGEDMTLKEALKLRQGIDESINFGKKAQDLGASEQTLYDIRNAIRDKMDDVISKANVAEAGALKAVNRKYGNLSTAQELLDREVARNQTNAAVSLRDAVQIAGGNAAGGPAGAAVAGVISKASRAFGNSVQARGFDAAAKALAKAPGLAALAESHPAEFSAIVNRIAQATVTAPENYKISEDPILQDQKLLQLFQQTPGLLDNVQDPRRRALIKEALKRMPAGK